MARRQPEPPRHGEDLTVSNDTDLLGHPLDRAELAKPDLQDQTGEIDPNPARPYNLCEVRHDHYVRSPQCKQP